MALWYFCKLNCLNLNLASEVREKDQFISNLINSIPLSLRAEYVQELQIIFKFIVFYDFYPYK